MAVLVPKMTQKNSGGNRVVLGVELAAVGGATRREGKGREGDR